MKHEMHMYTDRYVRTYGYAYQVRLSCSCGHETKWQPTTSSLESFKKLVENHREDIINKALGLEFTVV